MKDGEEKRREAKARCGLPISTMSDRLPPHAIEAEQALLGTILLDPKYVFTEIADRKIDDYFYDLRHQVIFNAMNELMQNNKPVDLVTVVDALQSSGHLVSVGGVSYLSALPDVCPTAANAMYYVEILAEKYALRCVIATCTDTVSRAYESEGQNPQTVIDKVSRSITNLALEFAGEKTSNIKELVHSVIADYENEIKGGLTEIGLPTGLRDYDKLTGGVKPGEYIIIAARPSIGKTSLAMNIVEHIAIDQHKPVGVFSLEMPAKSLVDRMICSRSRVNRNHIREKFVPDKIMPKLAASACKVAHSPIYIDDTCGLNILQLRARAKKWALEYGIRLLVIDYLQLIETMSHRYENRAVEITRVSAGIKTLLKELNIPGIILAQLNRDIEKDKKSRKPRLSDLKESGSLEQDADTVGMLYRPKEDEDDDNDQDNGVCPVNLIIRKQRNGPTGEVPLTFFKQFTRFESASKVEDVGI